MLFIVCALACEAKPLISHFRLQRMESSSPFPIYRNSSIVLVISGIGKGLVAAAIGYLQALMHPSHSIWLNIGIAGHASLSVGTGVLAHQIIDQATRQCYYPVFTFDRPAKTAALLTVDQLKENFVDDYVHEMEAAAFWNIASRFTTGELIHCYKIISDNSFFSTTHLTKLKVEELIAEHLMTIEKLTDALQDVNRVLLRIELPSEEIEPFLQRWHFTATQKHQLKHLLQRWRACTSDSSKTLWDFNLLAQTKSRHVLEHLEKQLKALSFSLSKPVARCSS